MKAIGCVAVSRGRSRDDHAVLDQAAEEVAGGKNILVFPEGTRAPDEEFLPFKKGGVLLAIKAGVPILPFGLSGTGRIIPARVLSVNPGPVRVEFGDVITTEGRTIEERDALLEGARSDLDLFIPDFCRHQERRPRQIISSGTGCSSVRLLEDCDELSALRMNGLNRGENISFRDAIKGLITLLAVLNCFP